MTIEEHLDEIASALCGFHDAVLEHLRSMEHTLDMLQRSVEDLERRQQRADATVTELITHD